MNTQHIRRRAPYGVALAALTAATLAGCTLAPQPTTDKTDPPATDDATGAPAATSETLDGVFGSDSVTYADGISISLSTPETFNPSGTAYTEGNNPFYVKFTVNLTNGTDERFDPILTNVSLASADAEGTPVFDVTNGLSNAPTTDIPPGKSRSWVVAFGVTDPDDLTAEVQLGDFVHDPALFALPGGAS